ncbi:MAG: nucleotidyltransferase domain-containing protein [Phycisphaerales bacterium]|nr:nucleotidyltransferase domain-containing protein [Phycisphaerales bacterium]
MFKWPRRDAVVGAAEKWAAALVERDAAVVRVGYIGSYARGDWGVGSDLDVIVILSDTSTPPLERQRHYYPDDLPVHADVWVYTQLEWNRVADDSPGLFHRLCKEWRDLSAHEPRA